MGGFVHRPINRIAPKLPVTAMQTYAIDAPAETHFRPATCQEVDCAQHERGWQTTVDESTELGQRQAHYIRKLSERRFSEHREMEGLTTFVFPAGQTCFRPHQVRIDRPEIFSVVGGDWRGRTNEGRILPAHGWVEHMQEGLEKLQDTVKRG